jgi:hypothetical protein
VITNIALVVSIWGLLPLHLSLLTQADRSIHDFREFYLKMVPFLQAAAVMSSYNWPVPDRGHLESTYVIPTVMLVYMLLGVLFAWFAKRRFRRDIF